ncbi:SAV_2336 N-terminal domain-related protein [Streptomyces sp. NPDC057623]|uniref:SAV_2336 N-terminal domain-related protein n=1 Tax=Streptomyces sp. NPDC057623 TaxID=3346187 RepID=UPI0036A7B575
MPSESAGRRPPLVRLADVLAEAAGGVRPTPLELAELLWLARHMEPGEPAPEAAAEETPAPDAPATTPPPAPERPHDGVTPSPRPTRVEPPRAPLHLPAPRGPAPAAPPVPHSTLLAPAPPMLRHPLALQRSLRPLKRRTDAPDRLELDERATADRIARLGAAPEWWLPVLRPARERWLRLNLVYDAGPTMAVWRPLIRELHTALAQSGIFRTVTVHRADPDGGVRPGTPAPTDGRTVTLLVSDCMGPQWRQGPAGPGWFGTLRRWAHRMPLAVVQPLPEHLWRDTALPASPGRLSAPHPAAPSASLAFVPYDGPDAAPEGAVALPVLEPGPDWLANWASLVAAPGGREFPGAAALLNGPRPGDRDDRTDLTGLSPEELVLRFRATASPAAFRLAGHLALGRPDLPVMRLVHAGLEPHPRPQHLAEVILSGMLTGVPGPPGSYAFRDGVRELLLRSLPRTARERTTELLAHVGGLIDERAGTAPGEFRASTPAASGTATVVDAEPFATVRPESVRALGGGGRAPVPGPGSGPGSPQEPAPRFVGGRYRLLEKLAPHSEQWRAQDTEADRIVTVRLLKPITTPDWRAAFHRGAQVLRDVDDRHVATVHDFGFDAESAYLVTEYLDGTDLNSLVAGSGYDLPAPLLMSVAAQLTQAVMALHDAGVAHGGLAMSRVVLLPDGTLKLAPTGRPSGAIAEDRQALGSLLFELAAGSSPPKGAGIQPHRLVHLPLALQQPFADALTALMSANRARQGLDRLVELSLSPLPYESYDRRSYHVLGPLRAELSDRPRHLPPDCAAMLAMLLFKHGRAVTHDELRAGVWDPDDRPANTEGELSRMASRLRISLGSGALASHSGGRYALHTSVDYVDIVHCDELVRRADEARAAGSFADARALVTEALGLWSDDDVLADVPGPAARTARTRLQQLRLGLLRARAELDLEIGEFERAATDLTELLRLHPSREDFRRLYLIALRRQGRVEEAVEVYEEYEVSGGQNPELLSLGRELRDEFEDASNGSADGTPYEELSDAATDTDTAYGFAAAPYELPEGFILPEDGHPRPREELSENVPHPQDHSPDNLFHLEDTLSAEQVEDAYDEPPPDLEPEEEPDTDQRDCVGFEFVDGPPTDEARAELRRLVMILVEASGFVPGEYLLRDTDRGFTLLLRPYLDGAPLFRATVAGLPELLGRLEGRRLRVDFWEARFGPGEGEVHSDRPDTGAVTAALNVSGLQAVIAVSEFWHFVEVSESSLGADRFTQLGDATGWYTTVHPTEMPDPSAATVLIDMTDMLRSPAFARTSEPAPSAGPAVAGPFPMPSDGQIPLPGGESEIVVSLPGGELVPADYAVVRSAPEHVRATWHYFEVDPTERRLAPEDVPGVEVRWRVRDPVTAASTPDLDLPELLTGTLLGARGSYGNELTRALGDRHVPGYLVHWSLPTVFRTAAARTLAHWTRPAGSSRSSASPSDLIVRAECVLIGFDGVLTRLYTADEERQVLRDVARLILEERDPEDALSGRPLLEGEGPVRPLEGYANSLDLLRAFAGHELAEELRGWVDRHDVLAASTARPVPSSSQLVNALHAGGARPAVVTDRAGPAVVKHLEWRGLTSHVPGGVHGRGADLTRLMPDPYVLQQALDGLGARAADCVLIGSTVAEQLAARAAGVRFIGFCPNEQTRTRLRATDDDVLLVSSLRPLLTAARYR